MLNPRDLLQIPIEGDDDVGSTYSDQPSMDIDVGEIGYSQGRDHRTVQGVLPLSDAAATSGQLAANGENVYRVQYIPDAWIVTVPYVVGANVEVYTGVGGGIPIARLGPAGWLKLPATTLELTIRNISSTVVFPVVVACSGFGRLDAGDFYASPGNAVQAK